MNNGYYSPNNMGFEQVPNIPSGNNDLPMEQSYVENILRLNKGKIASFYMSYPDSNEWRDKIFTGRVEQAARDHVVVFDPKNGKWYLLLSIYLNYIVFDEEINYKVI
ncbi:MAG: spore coat protein GerQ [Bacilli bacterium]|nr:spore coat protein GerQ [Mycoplasmatota bacterium]MDY4236552.1 spore coat protein GerQ [Bacilli bacterium]